MKKKNALFFAFLLLISTVLGGCGTTLYKMTDEEEELIVQYAAYTLGKYNSYQKDGLTNVSLSSGEESTQDSEETEEPDTVSGDNPDAGNSPDAAVSDDTQQGAEVTLAEAVGCSGQLEVTYDGCYITDSYMEGSHYAVNAKSGNSFVVMEFTMENITGEEQSIDILALEPTFRLSLDGNVWVSEDVTLLLYDLSTYQGTLAAGEQVSVVLLFEFSDVDETALDGVSLAVGSDGVPYPVGL